MNITFNLTIILFSSLSAPLSPAENLTVVDVTATTATIGWYPAHPNNWNGVITQYIVTYQLIRSVDEDESSESTDRIISLSIPSPGQPLVNQQDPTRVVLPLFMETAHIDGLEEYYVYRLSVYFETSAGRSPTTSSIDIETLSSGRPVQPAVCTCK